MLEQGILNVGDHVKTQILEWLSAMKWVEHLCRQGSSRLPVCDSLVQVSEIPTPTCLLFTGCDLSFDCAWLNLQCRLRQLHHRMACQPLGVLLGVFKSWQQVQQKRWSSSSNSASIVATNPLTTVLFLQVASQYGTHTCRGMTVPSPSREAWCAAFASYFLGVCLDAIDLEYCDTCFLWCQSKYEEVWRVWFHFCTN